jgi:hypothetical protein
MPPLPVNKPIPRINGYIDGGVKEKEELSKRTNIQNIPETLDEESP